MIDPMGIFRTTIEIAPLHNADARRTLADVMVDTESEYNWAPAALLRELGVQPVRTDRFETADGRILEREVGFALFSAAGRSSPAVAVFAMPGDMILLGAHGLEGMNLASISFDESWFSPDRYRPQRRSVPSSIAPKRRR